MDELRKIRRYIAHKVTPAYANGGAKDATHIYADYKRWVNQNLPDYTQIFKLKYELDRFSYIPLISVVMVVSEDEPGEIRESLDSVLGQIYDNWKLYVVADSRCSKNVRQLLVEYAEMYSKIKLVTYDSDMPDAELFDEGIRGSKGEYVAILQQGDVLWPNALYSAVEQLNANSEYDYLYTDEDQIPDDRHDHIGPFFKPDWSPELLESVDYVTCFLVVSRKLYDRVGGFQSEYGSAYLYDFAFRATRVARGVGHVSTVAYSRRLRLDEDENIAAKRISDQKNVLRAHVGKSAEITRHDDIWEIEYPLQGKPLVSIVIPTKDQYKVLKRCIDSIIEKTKYEKYEIILVDTGSNDAQVFKLYEAYTAKSDRIRVIEWREDTFSYSRSCNEGVRQADGDILVMLNNDTEVLSADWLEQLAAEAQRTKVGAVGSLLLYPDGQTVQHAGVGVGLGGVAANLFSKTKLTEILTQSQRYMLHTRRNVAAVTGACMAIEREVFNEVGGFDEKFRITYNDVDLCLRLIEKGYRHVYLPRVTLKHYESLTLGLPEESIQRDSLEFEQAKRRFIKQWRRYIEHDPYMNQNIDKTNAFYKINT